MTNQEWESRMNELRDAQLFTQQMLQKLAERHDNDIIQLREAHLVTQRLMELNERRWSERFQRHDDQIAEFRAGMLELRVAMSSLIAHIDRFVQGRGPDGH